ncbi:MAG: hypothetical protein CMO81_12365 [Waddliaceae bacterium]|nr:hypothetical protein [Waddliaceae bacterium]
MVVGAWQIALLFLLPLTVAAIIPLFGRYAHYLGFAALIFQFSLALSSMFELADSRWMVAAGDWLAPYGIVLVLDSFSSLMQVMVSLLFLCCTWSYTEPKTPYYWTLILLLLGGVSLSLMSGDLFNLFVGFELMLMSSYTLMCSEGDVNRRHRAGSYLAMNVMASFVYLIAIAVTYGITGQLNFASLSLLLEGDVTVIGMAPAATILIVLMIKSAIFPLYFWLPDSYPTLPSPIGGLFAGVLSKVGLYVLFRLFMSVFSENPFFSQLLIILGCLTMFFGVMGAVSQKSFRGILSYHTTSQVGYIVLALALGSEMAIAAGVFFLAHNMVVKCGLFLIGDIAEKKCCAYKLENFGALWTVAPFLGLLFLAQALSLAGLPPFSGFWAKYLLFFEGIRLEAYLAIGIALLTSFFTLYSMIKIWNSAFIGDQIEKYESVPKRQYIGSIVLTVVALGIGLYPEPLIQKCQRAASSLIARGEYQQQVFEIGIKGSRGE